MKLFLIHQDVNQEPLSYHSAVVMAETEEDAKKMFPGGGDVLAAIETMWCKPEHVQVQYLGEADESLEYPVICSDFY